MKTVSLSLVLAVTSWLAVSAATIRQAFHLDVLSVPVIVRQDSGDRLAYEIHATNFASVPLTLVALQISDADTRDIISRLDGASLSSLVGLTAARGSSDLVVAPGARVIVYVDAMTTRAPRRVRHAIDFDAPGAQGAQRARVESETEVSARTQPVLGPPLRGGPWVAVYDPQLERGHRRVVYAVDGRARIPGRFAIDWMKPRNASSNGDGAAVTRRR